MSPPAPSLNSCNLCIVDACVVPRFSAKQRKSFTDTLVKYMPTVSSRIFAFGYFRKLARIHHDLIDRAAPPESSWLFGGWGLYDAVGDYNRMQLPWERWRLSTVNDNFDVCASYPKVFVVPKDISDYDLKNAAKAHKEVCAFACTTCRRHAHNLSSKPQHFLIGHKLLVWRCRIASLCLPGDIRPMALYCVDRPRYSIGLISSKPIVTTVVTEPSICCNAIRQLYNPKRTTSSWPPSCKRR
jgi:hypothetical protein